MADAVTNIDIRLRSTADTGGVREMRGEFSGMLDEIKRGVVDALSLEGVDKAFIDKVSTEFEQLGRHLESNGVSADEASQKIATMVQRLEAAAQAENKRLAQLKTNFEAALQEKGLEEEALALARRRREEDRLASELEEIATRKRLAALQMERELERSVAQARQMSAEQRIERDVLSRGAYDPREEVARLADVEAGTNRVAAAKARLRDRTGEAAMQAAFLFDDLQYGFRGVLNNIPMLLTSLGAGAGLAGIVSIAAVSVSFLWDKFSGAKEAVQKTDAAKQSFQEFKGVMESAAEAADKVFENDLESYLNSLREATNLWAQQKANISEALQFANDLAKAEQDAAKAKLEIERQVKLAEAKNDDDRKIINAAYDARSAAIDDTGKTEALKRAAESQKVAEASMRMRLKEAEQALANAQGAAKNEGGRADAQIKAASGLSDEGIRLGELRKIRAEIAASEEALRNAATSSSERERLEKRVPELYNKRDQLSRTETIDQRAIDEGRMTFAKTKKKIEGIAEQAAVQGNDAQALQAEQDLASIIEAERQIKNHLKAKEAIDAEAKKSSDDLLKLKLELIDLEKRGVLLRKQQLASELEESAKFAKAGTDKVISDQQAAEALKKKQIEEQQRKLENDARAAERGNDPVRAAELRNKAERNKLPGDVTPEQQRAAELEAEERLRKARDQAGKGAANAQAQGIGERAGSVAAALGPAGEALKGAADALKDGASSKEVERLTAEFRELAPVILQTFKGQADKMSQLLSEMERLKSQLRTMNL